MLFNSLSKPSLQFHINERNLDWKKDGDDIVINTFKKIETSSDLAGEISVDIIYSRCSQTFTVKMLNVASSKYTAVLVNQKLMEVQGVNVLIPSLQRII